MSGYGGPDDESEYALTMSENGIRAAQSMVEGPVLTECMDCGDDIDPKRVEALQKVGMRCMFCIHCQLKYDAAPKIRMLDRIL